MNSQLFKTLKFKLPILLAASLAVAPAFADNSAETVAEKAVMTSVQDKSIVWNKCPDFLPAECGIAILHGDPAKNNADIFFKVPAKSAIPLHTHTSAERMILVAGKLSLTYDNQKEIILNPGNYTYGPANLAHKGYCMSSEPCVLFIAFETPIDAIPSHNH